MQNANTPSPSDLLLGLLADIHEPAPIDEIAPGWWWLGGLGFAVLLLGAMGLYFLFQHRRQQKLNNLWREDAKQVLDELKQNLEAQPLASSASQLNALIKRVVLVDPDTRSNAGLNGSAWADFLHQSTQPDQFEDCDLVALQQLAWASKNTNNEHRESTLDSLRDLIRATENWLHALPTGTAK